MKLYLLTVFLGVCALASAQLDGGGGILGGGNAGSSGGGLGGGGGAMKPRTGSGAAMGNAMLMSHMAMDPSAMSLPALMMMRNNPSMMQNPMGAFMMSSMLGVDVNKIATPMAMMNGMGGGTNLMRWLPLMMGDPSAMGLMLSMGLGGGGGMGGMGGLGPLGWMAFANA